MKATLYHEAGGPEVLQYTDVPDPEPGPGDVVIDVPKGHRADVSLRGEDVDIVGDFDGRIEEERAEGSINGGGPPMKATTSDGTVTLRLR